VVHDRARLEHRTDLVEQKLKDVVRDMDGTDVDVTLIKHPVSTDNPDQTIAQLLDVFVKGDPHLMGSDCSCCAEKRALVLQLRLQGYDV
jgi:hypothetical protein